VEIPPGRDSLRPKRTSFVGAGAPESMHVLYIYIYICIYIYRYRYIYLCVYIDIYIDIYIYTHTREPLRPKRTSSVGTGAPESMQVHASKLPWAATTICAGRPAALSRESMF